MAVLGDSMITYDMVSLPFRSSRRHAHAIVVTTHSVISCRMYSPRRLAMLM